MVITIEQANGEIMAINAKDGHPSEHLHKIYAENIFEELKPGI